MRFTAKFLAPVLLAASTLATASLQPLHAQDAPVASSDATVPARILARVNDAQIVRLEGNTHPMARPEFDKGPVDPNKLLEKIVLVLKRSPEQEEALAASNARQLDPKSPDFHHWIDADEFGRLYGPADSDITSITSWLQNHGFQINQVTKGRVSIQFTGTVAQWENWTGMLLPDSGSYVVPDALSTLQVDRDADLATLVEPGIWILHR